MIFLFVRMLNLSLQPYFKIMLIINSIYQTTLHNIIIKQNQQKAIQQMNQQAFVFKLKNSIQELSSFIFFLSLFSVCVSPSLIYNQTFAMGSSSLFSLIQIKNSDILSSESQLFQVQVHLYLKQPNGTVIIDNIRTANTVVKLWKNLTQNDTQEIMSLTYDNLTHTKKFYQKIDRNDGGQIDLQALYELKSNHKFLTESNYNNQTTINYSMGTDNQTLFVLGVYRFTDQQFQILNYIFPSNNWTLNAITQEQMYIEIFIYESSSYQCGFCNKNITFCPTKNCRCFQDIYQNCKILRQEIKQFDKVSDKVIHTQDKYFYYYQNKVNNFNQVLVQFATNIQIPLLFLIGKSSTQYPLSLVSLYNYGEMYNFSLSHFNKLTSVGSSILESNSSNLRLLQDNSQQSITFTIPPLSYLYITVFTYHMGSISNIFTGSITIQKAQNQNISTAAVIDFFVIIIAVFCVLLVILILTCACRYFLYGRSSQSSNPRKIINLDYENLKTVDFPSVFYQFLRQFIFSHKRFNNANNKMKNQSFYEQEQNNGQSCSICLQEFNASSIVKYTYCGHVLHAKCLKLWFNKQASCPLCRQLFTFEQIAEYQKQLTLKVVNNKNPLIKNLFAIQNINIQSQWVNKMLQNGNRKMNIPCSNMQVSLTEEHFQNSIKNKAQPRIMMNQQNLNRLEIMQADSFTDLNKKSRKKIQFSEENNILSTQNLEAFQLITIQKLSKIYKFYKIIYLFHELNKINKQQSLIFQLKSSETSKKQTKQTMFGLISSQKSKSSYCSINLTPLQSNAKTQENKQICKLSQQIVVNNSNFRANQEGENSSKQIKQQNHLRIQKQQRAQNQLNYNMSKNRIKEDKSHKSTASAKANRIKRKGFSADLNELQMQINLKSNPKIQQSEFKQDAQSLQAKNWTQISMKQLNQNKRRQKAIKRVNTTQNSPFMNYDDESRQTEQQKSYFQPKYQNNNEPFKQEPLIFSQYSSSNRSSQQKQQIIYKDQTMIYQQNLDQTRSASNSKVFETGQTQQLLKMNKMSVPFLKYDPNKIAKVFRKQKK